VGKVKLEQRVVTAAEAALARQKYVSPLDVLSGIGWLPPNLVDQWRQGRIDHLEKVLTAHPDRLGTALQRFLRWVEDSGLQPSETEYVAATRDRRPLRFTSSGDPELERVYRTHWMSPELSDARRRQLTERQSKAPDLLVVLPVKDWTCTECGGTGDFLIMEDPGPLCLTCADLDHLVFLAAGDAALTRRAKKASGLAAVVVRWNRSRRRYERQGILIEEVALEQAEEQCLADSDIRERRRERDQERRAGEDLELQARMAEKIVLRFPGCPDDRAKAIARHTATRGSGRVGRSAAGRALDDEALRRAVIASIRHEDTSYDELLMSGIPRNLAREQIRDDIDRVLAAWSSSG
jgi:hypothetical protein